MTAFDARGNMTSTKSNEALNYDALNRLTRQQDTSSDWTYLFNAVDERLVKSPQSANVLRRQMAVWLIQARGESPVGGCPTPLFADVPCSDSDFGYIQKLGMDGITLGCGGGNFCPGGTVARDEMATFLAKAKYCPLNVSCPAGSVPPAPDPGWTDVTPSNPHFANINRIYADGVTGGCGQPSPPSYCPSVLVSRWQMMVFLSRYWPAYDPPVAANSIYTFRDEGNRVATELLDAAVTRDNVYLGSFPVASRTSLGWEYYTVDHLGTPRRATGAASFDLKYWPYGDEPGGALPAQRLQFAAMERDIEGKRYYDHARSHDFNLGRFVSPDRLGGFQEDPQTLNRYSYALTNPLAYTDPSGLDSLAVLTKKEDPCKGLPAPCESVEVSAEEQTRRAQEEAIRRAQADVLFDLTMRPYLSFVTGSNNDIRQLGRDLFAIALNSAGPLLKGLPVGLSIKLLPAAGLRLVFKHGARHLAEKGFSEAEIALAEALIRSDIAHQAGRASVARGAFWGRVMIAGRVVTYRAFALPDGLINVGTTTLPR